MAAMFDVQVTPTSESIHTIMIIMVLLDPENVVIAINGILLSFKYTSWDIRHCISLSSASEAYSKWRYINWIIIIIIICTSG